jgi:hypothetical protein
MSEADLQRLVAETRKLLAEHDKLFAETRKLGAERDQLTAAAVRAYAETAKLNRDRWLAPLVAVAAAIGTAIGAASAIYRLILG